MLKFCSRELSNTSWSYALLVMSCNCVRGLAVSLFCAASDARDTPAASQDISNIAWSYATVEVHNRPMSCGRGCSVVVGLGDFATQHIANLPWSFPSLGYALKPVQRTAVVAAWPCSQQSWPQRQAQTMWSVWPFSCRDRPLLTAPCAGALPRANEYTGQSFANRTWSEATAASWELPRRHSASGCGCFAA